MAVLQGGDAAPSREIASGADEERAQIISLPYDHCAARSWCCGCSMHAAGGATALLPEADDSRILADEVDRPATERAQVNLNYTPEDEAFREQVRSFLRAKLPGDISQKLKHHKPLSKE